MEINEFLEGKKTDNLEDTSASDEAKVDGVVGAKPAEENSNEIPNLSNEPVPTEEEKKDAGLEGDESPINEVAAEPVLGEPNSNESEMENSVPEENPAPVEQGEPTPVEPAPVEPVNEEIPTMEENGVTEMPATKVFTQSQVNEMVGNTRTETREKTFRNIYDRYGVKDEAELDELVGNAQALDSFKEKYETERAGWKQSSADRDKELMDVKEQVALLQSGIDSDRFEDAKFILRGKGLEVNIDNIKNELATHPEWQHKAQENENFAKVGEGTINANKPAEPSSQIAVLGNEANNGNQLILKRIML